jgi:hypothetical protein
LLNFLKLFFSEQTPDSYTLARNLLDCQINQATNCHGRDAQIEQNQTPTGQRDAGLIDIVPEYGLELLAGE